MATVSALLSGPYAGYTAAFISCLGFGSFGVPMKAIKNVDVDPLVFQTYKTSMCLATSLLVPFLVPGTHFTFTPWGIVSGLFWVPGGFLHVIGIRTAGLAIANGTCSSIIVMVSFSWGIVAFHERVYSMSQALIAVLLMICGICGMSYYSSYKPLPDTVEKGMELTRLVSKSADTEDHHHHETIALERRTSSNTKTTTEVLVVGGETTKTTCSGAPAPCKRKDAAAQQQKPHAILHVDEEQNGAGGMLLLDEEDEKLVSVGLHPDSPSSSSSSGTEIMMLSLSTHLKRKYDISLTPAQLGLLCTAIGAIWGGSVMVPLHYAGAQAKGMNYVFSFAVGASIINTLLWIFRYTFQLRRTKSLSAAYHSLPSFYLKKMGTKACCSGILWSIGNMASIISVTELGEGVGYSLTQSSMLVGGLWGVFYFHEIRGKCPIAGWFVSALVSLVGIVMLSRQHVAAPPQPMVHHKI